MSALKFRPLRVTAYTVCTAAGTGCAATLKALDERNSGLTRNDFGPTPARNLDRSRGRSRTGRTPGRVGRVGMSKQPAGVARARGRRLQSMRSPLRASAMAPQRIAVVIGTSTASIGASEDAYRRLEPDGRYPADLRRPIVHTPHSLGDFVQHALGAARHRRDRCDRVLVERQGLRAGRALDPCRSRRRGRRRRCRYALRQRVVRLQLAGADRERAVAGRSMSRATGYHSAKAAGFALLERANARPAAGTNLSARDRRKLPDAYHMSSPHPEGLGARLAMLRSAQVGRYWPPPTSTTSICTARPPPRPRRDRRQSGMCVYPVPGAGHAHELDQGLDRPSARRGRNHRGTDHLHACDRTTL